MLLFQQAESSVQNAMKLIETSPDAEQPARYADLVIEAIVEKLEAKQELFRKLDKAAAK